MPPALTVLRSFCWRHGLLLRRSPHVAEHLEVLDQHIGNCPHCFIRECDSTIYYLRFKMSSGSLKVLPMASKYVLSKNMTDFPSQSLLPDRFKIDYSIKNYEELFKSIYGTKN